MRLPNDRRSRLLRGVTCLAAAGLVAGCGTLGAGGAESGPASAALPANGPQADYPIVIGDAYQIDGTTFTPADTLNYDEVGYTGAESGSAGFTGAHHTLPVPSYVEVTSLETGRTVLVRLERRGPMDSTQLVSLSPAALAQLEAAEGTPVRVRRVNPPENHRALLRARQAAPLRMDTPMSLVNVLRRELPPSEGAAESGPAPATARADTDAGSAQPPRESEDEALARSDNASPGPAGAPALPPLDAVAQGEDSFAEAFAEESGVEDREPDRPVAAHQQADGGFVVQAAAFSTADRAQRVASAIGGAVTRAGEFYRVRTGPFATRNEAEASLAIVKAAGYTDARILTSG